MNWIRQNRLSTALLAILILGAGGLGYLIYSSWSNYGDVSDNYDKQTAELRRLQELPVFPDAANQKILEAQTKQYAEEVSKLQTELAASTTPLVKDLSATEFQKNLGDVVAEVTKFAKENNVALPSDFYLGFEQYRSTVPPAAAVPLLNMELQNCKQIATILIGRHIDGIVSFKRGLLPQESGGAGTGGAPFAGGAAGLGGARAGNRGEARSAALLSIYPVDLEFRALPAIFRDTINDIVKSPAFYVLRTLRVRNEQGKGPPRGGPPEPAAPTPAPAEATAAAPAGAPKTGPGGVPEPPLPERAALHYAVGNEHLDAAMRVEIVRFTPAS